MAYLSVNGLSKAFAGVQALNDVSFDVHDDELVVVLGATGAGKTTLLRCLCGLEQADSGRLNMQTKDLQGVSPADRDMALVFQNFSLYPDWSVERNLMFPLKAPGRKLSDADAKKRIAWAADLLHITHLLQRKASRLSGGEMQRVAIGRAIVRQPKLFLMDEPLTNLDAKLREALRLELVNMRRQLKAPMIYVTHDQAEALSMADRIVVIDQGRVLQIGTPREVYEQPVSEAVARQLGQPAINVFDVRVENAAWQTDYGISFMPSDAANGSTAKLGIRPEHFRLQASDAEQKIPATVRLIEQSGPDLIVLADIGHEDQRVHILLPKNAAIEVGQVVGLEVASEHITLWA